MLVWVMLGSALGGVARLWMVNRVSHYLGTDFPWGTLVVNTSGALLIGLVTGTFFGQLWPEENLAWQFFVMGVLGSYTTVSSFSLQTLSLLRDNLLAQAIGNIIASFLLCLTLVTLGFLFGLWLQGGLS